MVDFTHFFALLTFRMTNLTRVIRINGEKHSNEFLLSLYLVIVCA
jgi:hypothetical protein